MKLVRANKKSQPETTDAGVESLTRSTLEPWWQKQNSAIEIETETRCRMPAPRGERLDWRLKADGQTRATEIESARQKRTVHRSVSE
jgi:hypothetical protein